MTGNNFFWRKIFHTRVFRGIKSAYYLIRTDQYDMFRIFFLRKIARIIMLKYRFKWPQMMWWDNDGFNKILSVFDELDSLNTDRRWMLSQLVRLTDSVHGDTVECGVYRGLGTYIICKINSSCTLKRTHHVFDSFSGVSCPADVDGKHWAKGDLSYEEDLVRKNLADFSNIIFYKGWIPDKFQKISDRKFSFVHIDVDLFQPTKESLEFFYPRLNEGGIILCDDYGFTTCPGATKACDDFLVDKPEKMLAMSGGGGFFIKGVPTSVGWNKI
ncbi:TylF/MycF/NovP-related O-methyltransferase [Desulfomicrobium orale]|uniref:TylF/MycF/NovP-related O-methyltransferase n=1 Tax=Desulfomicrobium orale TaxID=132132 RepID=UPI0009FA0ACD|nr:TylF/MycF/NovP-related O-methyltransferase [Desulfomicrobium orale]